MNAGYYTNKLVSWETLTGTRPTIESDRTIAVVSFPLKSALQRKAEGADGANNEGKNGANNGANSKNVGKIVGKNVGKILSDRQRKILYLVTENHTISMAEMAKKIGVTTRTIEREIPKMKSLIRHIGPKNGGYWEIINP